MNGEAGELLAAVADKARAIAWIITSPITWGLGAFACFHAWRYNNEMKRKDLEEWRKLNGYGS